MGLDEKTLLAGFCESCYGWSYFIRGVDAELCTICGGKFSTQLGHQITTQRSLTLKTRARKREGEFGTNISKERDLEPSVVKKERGDIIKT